MPIPQPNLVPVKPNSSRITQSNGPSSGLCTETVRPLRLNVVMIESFLSSSCQCGVVNSRRTAETFFSRSPQGGYFVRVRRRYAASLATSASVNDEAYAGMTRPGAPSVSLTPLSTA
jgi:hypothetical protein